MRTLEQFDRGRRLTDQDIACKNRCAGWLGDDLDVGPTAHELHEQFFGTIEAFDVDHVGIRQVTACLDADAVCAGLQLDRTVRSRAYESVIDRHDGVDDWIGRYRQAPRETTQLQPDDLARRITNVEILADVVIALFADRYRVLPRTKQYALAERQSEPAAGYDQAVGLGRNDLEPDGFCRKQ